MSNRETASDSDPGVSESLMSVLRGVLIAWALAAVALALATIAYDPAWLLAVLWIVFASGLISVLALLPTILWCRHRKLSRNDRAMTFLTAGMAASMIRIVGTVALMVSCSYHLHLPVATLAGLVCGCYLFLTTVEIGLLARGLSRWDTAGNPEAAAAPFKPTS